MTSDGSRFARAVIECEKTSTESIECVEKLLAGLKQDSDRDGISLLEVKNHDLLAYLTEMVFLMERMASGGSIQVGGAVERTTKYRTILERIKPIEKKMDSQITKLVQGPSTKQKPGISTSEAKLNDKADGSTSESESEDVSETQKRLPTKILAVQNASDRDAERKAKRMEKSKRRALQSTLVQELRQQYSDAPAEEYNDVVGSARVRQMERDRLEHEESFLMRTRIDKKEIKRRRKEANVSAIDKLLHFGNYMAADDDLREQVLAHKKPKHGQKRKMSGGAKVPNGKKKKFTPRRSK